MSDFKNEQIFVVTGASSGIGQAVAWKLIKEGASVVGVDLNMDGLQVSTENPSTAMEQVDYQHTNATKRLINGQLYIEQNGSLYTLTGTKL